MASKWKKRPKNTEAVFEYLKECARWMRVETYGEIAEAIGAAENRVIAPISLKSPLGYIRDEVCVARGLP